METVRQSKPVGMLPPHPFDGIIDKALAKGANAAAVIERVCDTVRTDARLERAVDAALLNPPQPGVAGPSQAQNIRMAILNAVNGSVER